MEDDKREKCSSCKREMSKMILCNLWKKEVCRECEQLGLCQKCYASLPRSVVFALQAVFDKNHISFFEPDNEIKKPDHIIGNDSSFIPDRLSGIF